ncbi:translation initiation factor IF-2-like isoform X2 [Lutra lutra]|uniref:translation initiation factor IF-2-like isoform X2 n=1 Tax=Lutra lutra TaxID=9657 RepID=UPI001FD2D5B3|nr:translation initiation factor IF-2-like isoform X2 [Lutra lutra]
MGEGRCCGHTPPPVVGEGRWRAGPGDSSSSPPPSRRPAKSSAGPAALSRSGCSVTTAEAAPNSLSRSRRSLYLGKLRPWGDTPGGERIPWEAGTDPIGPSDKLVNKAPERRKLSLGKVPEIQRHNAVRERDGGVSIQEPKPPKTEQRAQRFLPKPWSSPPFHFGLSAQQQQQQQMDPLTQNL